MSEVNVKPKKSNLPAECQPKSGKTFRNSLHKPSPIYDREGKHAKVRFVPAFTIEALQKNTRVKPPPRCNMYAVTDSGQTRFSQCYLRGDIPMSIGYTQRHKSVTWSKPVESLDLYYYLPLFFEGLTEESYPYSFLIEKGIVDLKPKPHEVIPLLPKLVISVRTAVNTKKALVVCRALKCLQTLVKSCDGVGEALVPHYRKFLPTLNLYYGKPRHEYFIPNREENIECMVEETLQLLESTTRIETEVSQVASGVSLAYTHTNFLPTIPVKVAELQSMQTIRDSFCLVDLDCLDEEGRKKIEEKYI